MLAAGGQSEGRSLRIAMITQSAPSAENPMSGQYNLAQAKGLQRQGATVEVFVPLMSVPRVVRAIKPGSARLAAIPDAWEYEGVRMQAVRGLTLHPVFLRWKVATKVPRLGVWPVRRAYMGKLLAKLRAFKPDALHAHDGLLLGTMTRDLAAKLGVPHTLIEHDAVEWRRGTAVGEYYRRSVGTAAAVFGVGWPSVWDLRDELGLENARLCPNGVARATEEQRRTPRPEELRGKRVVLCVGSPIPSKGHAELLRAFAAVNHPGGVLAVTGPMSPEGERLATELKLGSRLLRLDRMPVQQLQQWMVWADVFALPSRLESFGMVYGEAMSAETPVILTSAAGIAPMLRHGEHGWIVPPDDQGALNKALEEAMHSTRLEEMGRAGRRLVEGVLTWDRSAQAVLTALRGEAEPEDLRVPAAPAGWRPPLRTNWGS